MVHVISNTKFARKCEDAGVDAIVAEGFEAGGHNGIEETTTLTLIPMVCQAVSIPVIGIGGITNTQDSIEFMLAGASAIQVGTGNFLNPKTTTEIINGLGAYLQRKNIQTTRDIIGRMNGPEIQS